MVSTVGVEHDLAVQVARRAPGGLNERRLAAQEPLLVGVEDRHQRHLRQVEPLTQQVDPDQNVELAAAQRGDDGRAFERLDVAVQVTHPDAALHEVLRELLRHLLGEGRHQSPLAARADLADALEQVVHLPRAGRTSISGSSRPVGRISCSATTPPTRAELPGRRRGRDVDPLADPGVELLEGERAVVESARQAEAELDQRLLAGAVAVVHAAHLRDASGATLVDDQQEVRGK